MRIFLIMILAGLTACSSTSTEVNIRNINSAVIEVETNENNNQSAKVLPIYQDAPRKTLPILQALFNQANVALNAQQWQQAITLAEKGLQIERKDPRFYWVLATAYLQLSNKKQSQDFAKQGLRFVSEDDELSQRLAQLLP